MLKSHTCPWYPQTPNLWIHQPQIQIINVTWCGWFNPWMWNPWILRACIFIEKTEYKLYPYSSRPYCSRVSSIIQNKVPYASDLNPDLVILYPQGTISCNRYKKGLLHLLIIISSSLLLYHEPKFWMCLENIILKLVLGTSSQWSKQHCFSYVKLQNSVRPEACPGHFFFFFFFVAGSWDMQFLSSHHFNLLFCILW